MKYTKRTLLILLYVSNLNVDRKVTTETRMIHIDFNQKVKHKIETFILNQAVWK